MSRLILHGWEEASNAHRDGCPRRSPKLNSVRDLILAAARNVFDAVYEEGGLVFALFKVDENNYQCVFDGDDRVFRIRLIPLWGVAPLVVPDVRRDAVLKYFEAIKSVSRATEGWLGPHDGGEICCQNEMEFAEPVETLVPVLPALVRNAGDTLARWWPGLVAVINSGMDPATAFTATFNVS